jgi:hypothetical protein
MAKRKKGNVTTRPKILEYGDWSAGDHCWAVLLGDTKPTHCEIIEMHPVDNVTPAMTVTGIASFVYRVIPIRIAAETGKEARVLRAEFDDWYQKEYKNKQKTKRKKKTVK